MNFYLNDDIKDLIKKLSEVDRTKLTAENDNDLMLNIYLEISKQHRIVISFLLSHLKR